MSGTHWLDALSNLWALVPGRRVRVKHLWCGARREGELLAPAIRRDQWWAPVAWDDGEDPEFFKVAGLEVLA